MLRSLRGHISVIEQIPSSGLGSPAQHINPAQQRGGPSSAHPSVPTGLHIAIPESLPASTLGPESFTIPPASSPSPPASSPSPPASSRSPPESTLTLPESV